MSTAETKEGEKEREREREREREKERELREGFCSETNPSHALFSLEKDGALTR